MANHIWGISDKNAGHISQLEAVLTILPIKSKTFILRNNLLGKIACPLLPLGVHKKDIKKIINNINTDPQNLPNFLLVIGRRNLSIALYLKKRLQTVKPTLKLIFLMPPGTLYNKHIDYIFIHRYKLKPHVIYPGNVIPIDFPPSKMKSSGDINSKNIDLTYILKNKCGITLNHFKKPYIGAIIGGHAKGVVWNKKIASLLCKILNNLLKINEGSLFVINSRRTGKKISKYIKDNLPQNSYFFDYNSDVYNPYMELLTKCDVLIVTGESTSMISDCITLNCKAKVLIFDHPSFRSKRFEPFREFLYKNNFATSLKNGEIIISTLKPQDKVTNSAYFIADFLNSLYN